MSERRGGPFDLFTVNDAKFYQRSLLVEDGLMGACAKTRGVTPNTWMKTCAHFPGPAVPARQPVSARFFCAHTPAARSGGREQQADREAAAPAAEAAECVQPPPPRATPPTPMI